MLYHKYKPLASRVYCTGLALLLHNFPEGVLTFFAGTADPSLGLRTAAAIALHNIPEGLAVAVPFAYATRRRTAGVLAALVSGLAEPLGAVLAWLFLRRLFTPGFLNGTVVLAAGVMVWVALAQLLPGALHPAHRTAGILGAAVGCLLMLLSRVPDKIRRFTQKVSIDNCCFCGEKSRCGICLRKSAPGFSAFCNTFSPSHRGGLVGHIVARC